MTLLEDVYSAKERQDAFAHQIIGEGGFFYDFGCEWADGCRRTTTGAKQGNNTVALEREFGWSGLLFDIEQYGGDCGRSKSTFFRIDLSKEMDRLKQILKDNTPTKTVDYVSIDTGTNATIPPIQCMFDCGIDFKVMTLEHDLYVGHEDQVAIRRDSRKLLHDNGYFLLFGDVTGGEEAGFPHEGSPWEDWWINPTYCDERLTSIQENNLFFEDCITKY